MLNKPPRKPSRPSVLSAVLNSLPYVHDLTRLVTLLQEEGQPVPDEVKEAGRLTRYAVFTRYPGVGDPVTEDDHERAVAIAERVVEWVEDHLDAGGKTPDSRTD